MTLPATFTWGESEWGTSSAMWSSPGVHILSATPVTAASTLAAGSDAALVDLAGGFSATSSLTAETSYAQYVDASGTGVYVSATSARVYARLPDFMRDADLTASGAGTSGTSTAVPLLRWLASLVDEAGQIESIVTQIASPTSSALTDPSTADGAWLPWLGQLVGVQIPSPTPDVPAARTAILNAVTGLPKGSKGSIAAAVSQILSGSTVTVTDHPGAAYALPVPAAPAVTVEGTAGSTSYTYELTASNVYGSTPAGSSTTITTGNATLSSTDYNLVGITAVPLPAGSSGNLVYDSNLANAIAAVGPTWETQGLTVGTSGGDWDVLNAGTDSAEWVTYGGSASPGIVGPVSQLVDVTPGSTITVSGIVTVPSGTQNGPTYYGIIIASAGGTPTNFAILVAATGSTVGVNNVSASYDVPAGTTQVRVQPYNYGSTIPAGSVVTYSQIQLTETSTVQAYHPGPLPVYGVYRGGAEIGTTTALAFEDTGQTAGAAPPTVNTTGAPWTIGVDTLAVDTPSTLPGQPAFIWGTSRWGDANATWGSVTDPIEWYLATQDLVPAGYAIAHTTS